MQAADLLKILVPVWKTHIRNILYLLLVKIFVDVFPLLGIWMCYSNWKLYIVFPIEYTYSLAERYVLKFKCLFFNVYARL